MSIYLTKIIFNNKVFAIYVNENGHKSFLQIENDKLIEPQKDDYESLNDLFNPDKNICYDILDDFLKLQEKQEENNKNISPKKSNKFDLKKVLYVLLSLNIGVTSFHITSIYHAFQNHISIQKSYSNQIWKIKHISPNLLNKQIEENQIDPNILYEQMQKALLENHNLSQEEKDMLMKIYAPIINEHGRYFDLKKVLDNLKNLTISYRESFPFEYLEEKDQNNILASVLNGTQMELYNANNIDEAKTNIDTVAHEACHVLHGKLKDSFGFFIFEALSEEISNEYISSTKAYPENRIIVSMLNELVGKETLLKCYYHTDFNDLVNKLINITGNTEDAIRLISYGDMIHSLTKIKNNNFMENETNLNNMKEEFVNLFNQYYKALYQKDMLEDPYLSACTDYFFNNNYLNIENYDPQYYEIYDLTKNYLKGEENFTIYTSYNYSNNGVYRKFYIDYDPKEPNLYQDTFNTQVHLIENEFNNNYNMNK